MTLLSKSLCGALAIAVLLSTHYATAQKGGGPSGGGGNTPASPQGQGGPNAQPPGSPAGITGGSGPIESTIFSYESLNADADAIAKGVAGKISTIQAALLAQKKDVTPTVILTTANDVPTFVQWRAIIGQGETVLGRIREAQGELNTMPAAPSVARCVPAAPPPAPPQPGQLPKVGAGMIGSVSDIQTAIQTIASITAVNETLSPSSGSMTDPPLMNLVGDVLKDKATVFVPSQLVATPLDDTDFGSGPLAILLQDLEKEREIASQDLNTDAGRLANWQAMAANKGSACTTADAANAAALVARWNGPVQQLTSAVAAVDGFEASLFSGQTQSQIGQGGPSNPSTQTARPEATPVPPITGGGNTNQPPSPASSPPPSGSTLQQILAVDFLYRQLLQDPQPDGTLPLAEVYFLELHSLESGGGLLTKSNLFLGSRLYFSGGAVATFSLFDHAGRVQCSGVAYAYQGYVKPENVVDTLASEQLQATLHSTCGGTVGANPAHHRRSR
jgi:hypothetical protein